SGWDGGASDGSVGKLHIGFDGWVAPRVKDLAANDFDNFHVLPIFGEQSLDCPTHSRDQRRFAEDFPIRKVAKCARGSVKRVGDRLWRVDGAFLDQVRHRELSLAEIIGM